MAKKKGLDKLKAQFAESVPDEEKADNKKVVEAEKLSSAGGNLGASESRKISTNLAIVRIADMSTIQNHFVSSGMKKPSQRDILEEGILLVKAKYGIE